jgi:hypothetical protein
MCDTYVLYSPLYFGYAVAYLVHALRYRPKSRGFIPDALQCWGQLSL